MSRKEKVLITGGAGYLGSILTRRLLEAGYAVTVLDNFLFNQSSLLDCCVFEDFTVVRGDCRDERLLRDHVKDADIVIPLAALVGAPLCDRDPLTAIAVNRDAVRTLLRLLSPNQCVLFPTTNSGYGIGEKEAYCTEDTPLNPISLYGRTKVEAEAAVLEHKNSLSFRLATVFGISPRMRLDLLVNDFVWRALRDRTVVLFEADFRRNYIHIEDVARVFLHAISHFDSMRGRPYNVGLEDANLTKRELCEVIRKVLPDFVYLEAPIGEDPDKRDYIVSNQRLLSTGFRPEWSLERGIRQLVNGYHILFGPFHSNV
ncbi:MAG: NAD(P)-dependent oxidoreductase [Candidatus Hydrogenedentota bacterium]|nr:MAG: NAD(P)-dependent oxidoreductase [Candidatus Hydrogenedentota bacterium]